MKARRQVRFDLSKVDVEHFLEVMKVENLVEATEEEWQFCVSPNARVLMKDLSWRPAGLLKRGEKLWGFDEESSGTSHGRRWRESIVLDQPSRRLPSSRVVLDDGTSILVSNEHLWLVDRNGKSPEWRKTSVLKEGAKLIRVLPTWINERGWEPGGWASGWLTGIFDGEAHLTQRSGKVQLAVAQNPGLVLEEIKRILIEFDHPFTERVQPGGCVILMISGKSISSVARFLGMHKPVRLFDKFSLEGVQMRRIDSPRVVKVEDRGIQEVIALKTSTKTFVCEGLASHNSCPFPGHSHGDQSPSAYMNRETTAWMCHGCKRSGNAITFYSDLENVTTQESRSVLQLQYGGRSPDPDSYSIMAELQRFWDKQKRGHGSIDPNEILDGNLLHSYALDWSAAERADEDEVPEEMLYMLNRGFTGETLDEWNIGIDYRVERITIPVCDERGRLVGFKGRAWRKDHKPKYLVMGGEKYDYPRFEKSQVVFGLDRVTKKYGDQADLILCEGELDVIAMHAAGFDTAVCVAGSDLSNKQGRLLRRWGQSAIVFFDTDEGGAFGTQKVLEALNPFISIRVVPDHEGDPADLQPHEIQQLLDESETGVKAILMAKE